MSRFPGLQLPTPGPERPLTRGEQRPGPNLLQKFFDQKKRVLSEQDQQFQEESFDAAKQAYDASLETYKKNKAAHDASEQAKYNAAQAQYNKELATFNAAKSTYDSQVADYNAKQKAYNDQVAYQRELEPFYRNRWTPSNESGYHLFHDQYGQPYYAATAKDWRGNLIPSGTRYYSNTDQYKAVAAGNNTSLNSLRPITAVVPAQMPSFSGKAPTFTYKTTAFGTPAPSFNYTAPESPMGQQAARLGNLTATTERLRNLQPADARNRNRSNTSIYNIY